jgi:GNAT superfamily N-acetyltransferase
MHPGVVIRAYSPADEQAVIQLLRLNTPKYFAPEEEKDLLRYLQGEIEHYFVMELDGETIGSGGYNFAGDPSHARISWDLLHPARHGQGHGSVLLRHRLDRLLANGTVRKITVRTSQLVYRFYEKAGFVLQEVVPDYWAPGYHLYLMVCQLVAG